MNFASSGTEYEKDPITAAGDGAASCKFDGGGVRASWPSIGGSVQELQALARLRGGEEMGARRADAAPLFTLRARVCWADRSPRTGPRLLSFSLRRPRCCDCCCGCGCGCGCPTPLRPVLGDGIEVRRCVTDLLCARECTPAAPPTGKVAVPFTLGEAASAGAAGAEPPQRPIPSLLLPLLPVVMQPSRRIR